MKLYSELQNLDYKKVTPKEIHTILRNCGVEQEFSWLLSDKSFTNFLFYFVHAYSFESRMMDSSTFKQSLTQIEKTFEFSFEYFNEALFGESFDDKYDELIAWYLEVQKNREWELLMKGNILYKQMTVACTSMSMLKKGKDEMETVDYKTKYEIFNSCVDLQKVLTTLEESLASKKALIENAGVDNTEKTDIERGGIRMENLLPPKK